MLELNGVYYFEIFAPYKKELFHAVSSKEAGSLRFDDLGARANFAENLNITADWSFLKQIHSDKIVIANENNVENYVEPPEADALITNQKECFLAVNMADCQAVLLFDPVKKVVSAVHSGWRGSAQNVVSKTIQKMINDFGCNPENILAGVSPSLGPCCSYFTNPQQELPAFLHEYILPDGHSVDFWRHTEQEFLAMGLTKSNIEIAKLCTKCNFNLFFSYRVEPENSNRMVALIGLLN